MLRLALLLILPLVLLFGWPGPQPTLPPFALMQAAAAETETLPLAARLPLFLKILSYDRNLTPEVGSQPVRVLVLSGHPSATGPRSVRAAELEALIGHRTLLGHAIAARVLPWPTTPDRLDAALDVPEGAPHLIVLDTPPRSTPPVALAGLAQRRLRVFADGPERVTWPFLSVVLLVEDGAPVIHIDLAAARRSGIDFHANFLKHCRVKR